MFDLALAINLLIAVAFLALGVVVLAKGRKAKLNKLFVGFVFFLSGWIVTNHFSNDFAISLFAATLMNHLVLFTSGIMILFLLGFVVALSGHPVWLKKHLKHISYFGVAGSVVTLSPLVVQGIEQQNQVYAIEFGPLAALYFFTLLLNIVLIVISMVAGIRNNDGPSKKRLVAIMWGLVVLFGINIATNIVLPIIAGNFLLTTVGPLSSIALVVALSYSIFKHRLFDLRPVLARLFAYLLSWTVISILVVGAVIGAASFLFGTEIQLDAELFVYIILGLIVVSGLRPLKLFFDKYTNKLFYQDAYDPQEFLDELNKVLVTKVDVEPLLNETADTIKHHLKCDFSVFRIQETEYVKKRLVGNKDRDLSSAELESLGKLISQVHQSIIVAEELESGHADIKELLLENNIAVVARLVTTLEQDTDGVGFLMLGQKKSGSPYGRQDIKILEIIANELVIAVQNALRFEEIEEFNVTLQQKVDDATKKLRDSNEKLKEMDETKDEFISMASHQLRTPLTSVKGYLSMVLEGDAGPLKPMQEKLLTQAFTSSQRMVYLISDLLNVSRLRTGKFIIESVRVNLADVVQGEVNQLQETAASRKLTLAYEKPAEFPELMLDETKIRQVIMNFIDNAIYYTQSGGTITVELKDKKESVELTVSDTGMGVPKADQRNLFTKFYRAGNARKARPDGTGLGLFMAKKVIVAQGGGIIFKSKEHEGSTFGFTLPKAKMLPQDTE